MTYSRDDDPEHAAEVKEATRRMREFNLEESRRPSEKKHSENAQSPPATPSPPATDIPFTQEELDQMAHDDAVEAARRRLQDMIHGEKVDAAARRMADLHVKEAERKAEADQEEAKRRAVRAAKEASFRQRVPRPPGQERVSIYQPYHFHKVNGWHHRNGALKIIRTTWSYAGKKTLRATRGITLGKLLPTPMTKGINELPRSGPMSGKGARRRWNV